MLILEIIQLSPNKGNLDQRRDQIEKDPNAKVLGSGYFGTVYSNPASTRGTNTVIKLAHVERDDLFHDGYFNYLQTLLQTIDSYSNPYLPVIHSVEIIGTETKPQLEVEMEKLEPFHSLDDDEANFVIRRIVNQEPNRKSVEFSLLSRIILQTINGGRSIYKTFPDIDPRFVEAVQIIKKLRSQGYALDIHKGNVMIRRTPYGPQLVLTDPLSWWKRTNFAGDSPLRGLPRPTGFTRQISELNYPGNIGVMELVTFFKKRPDLKEKFTQIKRDHGIETAIKWAAKQIGTELEPILDR